MIPNCEHLLLVNPRIADKLHLLELHSTARSRKLHMRHADMRMYGDIVHCTALCAGVSTYAEVVAIPLLVFYVLTRHRRRDSR